MAATEEGTAEAAGMAGAVAVATGAVEADAVVADGRMGTPALPKGELVIDSAAFSVEFWCFGHSRVSSYADSLHDEWICVVVLYSEISHTVHSTVPEPARACPFHRA